MKNEQILGNRTRSSHVVYQCVTKQSESTTTNTTPVAVVKITNS